MAKKKTIDEKLQELSVGMRYIVTNAVTKIELSESMRELKNDLRGVETRLTQRIEILEHRVLTEHSTRLDVLEDNVRQIKTKLGMA